MRKSQCQAAAARQLRHWYSDNKNGNSLLKKAALDKNGLVRLEAAIACSYIGTSKAFDTLKSIASQTHEKHLTYAILSSLGSEPLSRFWDPSTIKMEHPKIATLFSKQKRKEQEAELTKASAKFDRHRNLLKIRVKCIKERMLFDVESIEAKRNQPIRLEFLNPDATPHNLVLVQPGSLEEVGKAANQMAATVAAKSGQFIPQSKKIIAHTRMLKQGESEFLRFKAPSKPGEYPYLCTFPGHWTIMRGKLIVK